MSNYTDTDRLVYVEQAIESIPYKKEEAIELHTITSDKYTLQNTPEESQKFIFEHLNLEEKKAISKLCREFSDIFYKKK